MNDVDRCNWIGRLKAQQPQRRVLDTYIPGSHDSASSESGIEKGSGPLGVAVGAVTQSGDIAAQLRAGVRYFDIRCKKDGRLMADDRITLHHGIIYAAPFEPVLRDQIVAFSQEYPEETIFLDVDIGGDCEDEVLAILKRHIPEEVISTVHLTDDGDFDTSVTWGQLKGSRFVITWTSTKHTAIRPRRLFGDWGDVGKSPSIAMWNGRLYMSFLDDSGQIYLTSSDDGVDWPPVKAALIPGWAHVRGTPTLAARGDKLFMCLTDVDGVFYLMYTDKADASVWHVHGGSAKAGSQDLHDLLWTKAREHYAKAMPEDCKNVPDNPSILSLRNGIGIGFINGDGNLHFAVYDPRTLMPFNYATTDIIVDYGADGKTITERWSGAGSSPTFVLAADDPDKDVLLCCFTDGDGRIYVARFDFASGLWPTRTEMLGKRPFGDWGGVKSTPILARRDGTILMCLTDSNGAIYMAHSKNGKDWPKKADVAKTRLFGGQLGARSNPSLAIFGDAVGPGTSIRAGADCPLVMAFTSTDGGALMVADSADGQTFHGYDAKKRVAWLSFADQFRWSPYDDFDKHPIDEIIAYLDKYKATWPKDRMFIAQCIDTPQILPAQSPIILETLFGSKLNGWVMRLEPGANVNVIYRDFVTDNQDVVDHVIGLNFAAA